MLIISRSPAFEMTYSTLMSSNGLLYCSHSSLDLNQTAKTFFPKVYHARKQNFKSASCAKWPLPSCHKHFRIFWSEKVFAIVVVAFLFLFCLQSINNVTVKYLDYPN